MEEISLLGYEVGRAAFDGARWEEWVYKQEG